MESKDTGPAEDIDTECNERPLQSKSNKATDKRTQANAKARKHHHYEIGMDQQKTRQVLLFLGHHNINQVEMFATSDTKTMLLIQHNYIYQRGIFTSTHQIKP